MVGPTPFVFAFAFAFVFVCSMSGVVSKKPPPPCPNGTYPSWHHRCIYVNDNQGDDERWRMDRMHARTHSCMELRKMGSGYTWDLPSFRFNGKHEMLLQILQEHACDGECSTNDMHKKKEWRFWIRLIRQWKKIDDEEGIDDDDDQPMNDTSQWTWGADRHTPTLAEDLADGKYEFPPWAKDEPNEEFHARNTKLDKACVISKIKTHSKYPWFDWVVAPCELDRAKGKTANDLREAMKTNGILVCEGTPDGQDGITSTSSSTPPLKTTTALVPSMIFNPAFVGILVSFICVSIFFIGCTILYCFNRRRIHQLESTAKKSKFVSTTSSDIPSMSTLVNLDSIGRREDDDDESERERSRRKGKKK